MTRQEIIECAKAAAKTYLECTEEDLDSEVVEELRIVIDAILPLNSPSSWGDFVGRKEMAAS
jgi:hypothetical protein